METRANYVWVGAVTLAVLAALPLPLMLALIYRIRMRLREALLAQFNEGLKLVRENGTFRDRFSLR